MSSALGNVDVIVAVSQASLNKRLTRQFCSAGLLPAIGRATLSHPDGYSLTGWPCVREVSLAVGGVEGMALLFFRMLGTPAQPATFTFYDSFGTSATLTTVQFQRLDYAFHVPLVTQPITPAMIDQLNLSAAVRASLKALDPQTQQPYGVYLDLSNTDFLDYDKARSGFQGTLTATPSNFNAATTFTYLAALKQLQNLVTAYLTPLGGSANPFVLGYGVTTHGGPIDPGAWAPTTMGVATYDNPDSDDLNTLNFIFTTDGRPIGAGDGRLQHPLIDQQTPPSAHGIAAISADLFIDHYVTALLNSIRAGLQVPANLAWLRAGSTWNLSYQTTNAGADGKGPVVGTVADMLDEHYIETTQTTCALTMGTAGGSAGGDTSVQLDIQGALAYTGNWNTYPLGALHNEAAVTSTLKFHLSIALYAGRDGTIIAEQIGPGQPVPDTTVTVNQLTKAIDDLTSLFGGTTVQETLNAFVARISNLQTQELTTLSSDIAARLNALQTCTLLPDGQAFFFKNLSIDDQDNLRMEIRWKAENRG